MELDKEVSGRLERGLYMEEKFDLSPKFFEIFYPFAHYKRQTALANNQRFVYYTSAETAVNILKHKEIWMRNTTCMNDLSEVNYGLDCLRTAYRSQDGSRFKYVLNDLFPNICKDIEEMFNGWIPHMQSETYLTCVSEHYNEEDLLGRLSMWRAYGRMSGVALVVKSEAILYTSAALKAYSSPVAYIDSIGVINQLNTITENIMANIELIKSMSRDDIKSYVFNVFKFAILGIKHPGFKEEQEWRLVYSPLMEDSSIINHDVCVVNGIPQKIYKIPLEDKPESDYYASIHNIIDRIIIGPVEFPWVVYKSFVELLNSAGVRDAETRVFVSQIPLRR